MLFVNEMFASVQGEATFAGVPSVFVRMQGCLCKCDFCDTKYTWKLGEPNEKPITFAMQKADAPRYATTNAEELAETIIREYPNIKHIVFTGGEPCLFNLRDVGYLLEYSGRDIQVETSGTENIAVTPKTWVTISPKINQRGGRKVKPAYLTLADEIKMAVGSQEDIDNLRQYVLPYVRPTTPIYLQPISQGDEATKLCVETAMANNWRVSIQTHKYLNLR